MDSKENKMKVIGVIPARYESSRFPGKPLADICGKPMIWWVYRQVRKVSAFADVYVATDDIRIQQVCQELKIKVVMTSNKHPTAFSRICELSKMIDADFYVVINGDEPLINPKHIAAVIPHNEIKVNEEIAINTIAEMNEPSEVNDISNIKVVFDKNNRALYMSRTPIPFPNKRIDFKYWKHVGITGLSKAMLNSYENMPMGEFESIESIDHMRLIDAGKNMYFVKIDNEKTLSVDTPKDLEVVRQSISKKINDGQITLKDE